MKPLNKKIVLMEDIQHKKVLQQGYLYDSLSKFVYDRIATFTPHDIFVIDIAETPNGWKVLECGCVNGTGFYTFTNNLKLRNKSI